MYRKFSVNFIWFALLHKRFYNKPLLKPGTLWLATILNSLKTNIFVWLIKFCYKAMKCLHLWKKTLEKNLLCFLQKIHIYLMTLNIYIYIYIYIYKYINNIYIYIYIYIYYCFWGKVYSKIYKIFKKSFCALIKEE